MLEELLARAQDYDIDTKVGGFTNHLPMALIALDRLGASDARLKEYFQMYSENLKPLEYTSITEEFNWFEHLGERDKFGAYLEYYTNKINLNGWQAVLRSHIDKIIQGCAASAFHALIRLSYGIIQENAKEITFGLAHLSSHYLRLPESSKSENEPSAILNNALNTFSDYVASGDTITNRMIDIANHNKFTNINKFSSGLSLASLSHLFTQLYLRSSDFTVLHAVTSCHAMRIVLPYIEDKESALVGYWSAALVAILSVENLELRDVCEIQTKSLEQLNVEIAAKSNDDHLIKLVFSCIEEHKNYKSINHMKILVSKLVK